MFHTLESDHEFHGTELCNTVLGFHGRKPLLTVLQTFVELSFYMSERSYEITMPTCMSELLLSFYSLEINTRFPLVK